MEIFNTLSNWLLLFIPVPIVLFIFFYSTFSPWRRTVEGKTIMYQKVAFLLYFILAILGVYNIEFDIYPFIRFVIYSSLAGMFVIMLVRLLRAQRIQRAIRKLRKEKERNDKLNTSKKD